MIIRFRGSELERAIARWSKLRKSHGPNSAVRQSAAQAVIRAAEQELTSEVK